MLCSSGMTGQRSRSGGRFVEFRSQPVPRVPRRFAEVVHRGPTVSLGDMVRRLGTAGLSSIGEYVAWRLR